VIASPADGATLLYTPSSLSLSVAINKTPPYDLAKDFSPIVNVAISPYALVVNPSVPAKSLKEFIAYAKANPASSATARPVSAAPRISPPNCSRARPGSRWCTCRTRA
jgi:tripartite-type tricarboxylate transporter receptor subunit TctC